MNAKPTPPKRALLIFNPKSGKGPSPLPRFIAALGEKGWHVDAEELPQKGELVTLLSSAEHYSAVIAAGGDGTVSSIAYVLRNRGVPLLAYPAGTANLIAQNLNLPEDPQELAQVVDELRAVSIDLGELSVAGKSHGFVLLAGAGADAAMIEGAEGLKDRLGVFAYVVSALKQLSPKTTTFHLTLDGKAQDVDAMAVMVANFGMANFRLPIAPGVSPNDGQFAVLVLKAGSVLELLPNLLDSLRAKLNLGEPVFGKNIDVFSASEVEVSTEEPFPLQYDGEIHDETTPFTARVLPKAALLLTGASQEELET
ncbi:diacylglycerol kinase family lipid kinase [Deinococcus psychrotolerans]|uniref:Diacylglycerol kinase family lipid kinase n=1 Tax=Deinococcus psychrotolerans TaxID=2489213 RepID=A0A3G8YGW3_9DEIO|nr:diacylglycerol kinase family protein [Deinococcus psychrotolerans]AZI41794.1 diacylglycerol kinase family lipid kinase [Deinococcus psychrotolerans]